MSLKFSSSEVSHSNIYKLMWIFVFIPLFSALCFFSFNAFKKWKIDPDISVKISLKSSHQIPLAAITICTSAYPLPIQRGGANYFYKLLRGESLPNLTDKEKNYIAVLVHTCANHVSGTLLKRCENRTDKNIVKLLKSARSASNTDLCSFRGSSIDCSKLISSIFTHNGMCRTFNIQGYHQLFKKEVLSKDFNIYKRKEIAKFPYTLSPLSKFTVNDDENENQWTLADGYLTDNEQALPVRAIRKNQASISIITSSKYAYLDFCQTIGAGFQVIFHLPNEIPTPFSKQYFVNFEEARQFVVTAKTSKIDKSMQKFSPKIRNCYIEGEKQLKFFKSYTKDLCDFECLTNYTLKSCGCVKFSMPREQNTSVCDLDKVDCYREIFENWPYTSSLKSLESGEATCNCLPPCNNIEYTVSNDREFMKKRELEKNKTYILKLNTYYGGFTVEDHRKYVSNTFGDFLAELGGLIGLLLGYSVLKVFELSYKLVASSWKFIQNKKKVENSAIIVKQVEKP